MCESVDWIQMAHDSAVADFWVRSLILWFIRGKKSIGKLSDY
jgi:hypothetical protein